MATNTNVNVHELLTQLHHELKHADAISERDRQLFDHLSAHVRELIENPAAGHETLSARLEASIAEMEGTRPALTGLMQRVVSALSNMGV